MKLKNTILTSFLFFLVLASWYVIRGIRNEMAVENYGQDFFVNTFVFYSTDHANNQSNIFMGSFQKKL